MAYIGSAASFLLNARNPTSDVESQPQSQKKNDTKPRRIGNPAKNQEPSKDQIWWINDVPQHQLQNYDQQYYAKNQYQETPLSPPVQFVPSNYSQSEPFRSIQSGSCNSCSEMITRMQQLENRREEKERDNRELRKQLIEAESRKLKELRQSDQGCTPCENATKLGVSARPSDWGFESHISSADNPPIPGPENKLPIVEKHNPSRMIKNEWTAYSSSNIPEKMKNDPRSRDDNFANQQIAAKIMRGEPLMESNPYLNI